MLLVVGVAITQGINPSASLPLRAPLDETIPREIAGLQGRDATVPENERVVAGMTNYLLRNFVRATGATAATFSLYVGYYDQQSQGKAIHSPKNCLPGAGWEALQSSATTIHTASGRVTVNRYLLRKGDEQALALYWYQGRGRIQANEYAVKWNLLLDAALRHRTDEALVRIVVPLTTGSDASALDLASRAAEEVVTGVSAALPL